MSDRPPKVYAVEFSNGWRYVQDAESVREARARVLPVIEYIPAEQALRALRRIQAAVGTSTLAWRIAARAALEIEHPITLEWVMDPERETIRVDGRALCPDCGLPYTDHPRCQEEGFSTFARGCDDKILKL